MDTLNLLFLGDIIGNEGLFSLATSIEELQEETSADVIVVNGENSASSGRGLSVEAMKTMLRIGVDVITSGNHIWQEQDLIPFLESEEKLLRSANYPSDVPGKGVCYHSVGNREVAVINLAGRSRVPAFVECPFKTLEEMLPRIKERTPLIFIDLHAEDSREKEAFAWFADGLVTAVVGTHTHTQTIDERILPQGTGYITDLGMVGLLPSIIGSDVDASLLRARTNISAYSPVTEGTVTIEGLLVSADSNTGKCLTVERIRRIA